MQIESSAIKETFGNITKHLKSEIQQLITQVDKMKRSYKIRDNWTWERKRGNDGRQKKPNKCENKLIKEHIIKVIKQLKE